MPGLWVRASPGAHFLTRKRHLSRDTKPNFSGITLQIHSFHWIDWTDKTQGQPNRMADRCIQHEGCINLHLTNTKGWGVEGGPLSAHVGNGRRWRSQTSKWAQMRRQLAVVPRAGVWGGVVPASWEPALNEWTGRCVDGFPICEILLVYVPFGRGKKRIIELFIGEFRVILYQSIALDETYIFVFGFGLTGWIV